MNSADLRSHMQSVRTTLTAEEKLDASVRIIANVKTAIHWPAITSLHMYRAMLGLGEIDTAWIEAFVFEMWPHITVMVGSQDKTATLPTQQFDVIFVPLLAFDTRRNRIGYGGGWYDRFLSRQTSAVKIGLAYDFQRVAQLDAQPHDVALSMIVTEKTVYV